MGCFTYMDIIYYAVVCCAILDSVMISVDANCSLPCTVVICVCDILFSCHVEMLLEKVMICSASLEGERWKVTMWW